MKAVIYRKFGPPTVLEIAKDLPVPRRGPGQILIRVHAAAVNPVDTATRLGKIPLAKKNKILGADLSGIVEASDANSKFKPGDRVFALTDGWKAWVLEGTYAQFALAKEDQVAVIPDSVTFEQASAIPMAATTAWQALLPIRGKAEGLRVLIHGGAGGVGSNAVQIAKAWGMHVTATCGTKNLDFVRQELGADEVVDYSTQRVDELYRGKPFDVIIDPVGGKQQEQSLKVLAKNGFYGCIPVAAGSKGTGILTIITRVAKSMLRLGPWYSMVICKPSGAHLQELANLMSVGKLKAFIDKQFLLQEAAQAHKYMDTKGKQGKVVLKIV